MCGRFALMVPWNELSEYFNLVSPIKSGPDMPARYNIAPTQPVMMIGNDDTGNRHSQLVRWGFLPSWAKDPKEFTLIINARTETAIEKPSFKTAMRHRRMLMPASGFYEWKRFGKDQKSQPYWVRPRNGGLVAFGALMETWSDANGSEMDTGCVMTTDANDNFRSIHHRLPLVIHPKDFDQWLDCKTQEPRDVFDLMKPVEDDYFEAIPVGEAVNKVANTSAEIQQRVEPIQAPNSESDTQLSMF